MFLAAMISVVILTLRTMLDQLAIPDGEDILGVGDQLRIVSGEDERGAVLLLDPIHEIDDGSPGLAVEIGGRLIRQHQAWSLDQGAGDCDPLLLTAGELVRPVPAMVAKSHRLKDTHGAFRRSLLFIPSRVSGYSTFSRADNTGIRLKFWKIKPMFRARNSEILSSAISATLSPQTSIFPSVGWSRQPTILSRVVLPLPDGPRTMENRPLGIRREIPFKAGMETSPT